MGPFEIDMMLEYLDALERAVTALYCLDADREARIVNAVLEQLREKLNEEGVL